MFKTLKNIRVAWLSATFFIMTDSFLCYGISGVKELSHSEIQKIGELVFKNECASKDENLIAWNEGEDFMSLGIGHFIWYSAGEKEIFKESFTEFLKYAKELGERLPAWTDKTPLSGCPWKNRTDLIASYNDPRLKDLKYFLMNTKELQAAFIVKRLYESLFLMLNNVPMELRDIIEFRFNSVASTPEGIYALADYVNFKGAGVFISERYHGYGWGLLQVLKNMRTEDSSALEAFVTSAIYILERRVKNAPVDRGEIRWLPGWKKRVASYLINKEG